MQPPPTSRNFAVLKEKHFRTTLLRSRATCMRDGSHDDTLATVVSLIDSVDTTHVAEWWTWNFVLRRSCLLWRVYVTAIKVQSTALRNPGAHFTLAANYFVL
jgi:hypothetical protein